MCNIGHLSGFLVAAKASFLAALVLLGLAMANSFNIFGAAATVAFVISAIATSAAATAMYVAALVELDRCATPCAVEFEEVRRYLIGLLATMAVLATALIGLAIAAWIPWVGSAAIGAVVVFAIPIALGVSAILEPLFAQAVQRFNGCRSRAGLGEIVAAVIYLSNLNAVVAIILLSAWVGQVPWPLVSR